MSLDEVRRLPNVDAQSEVIPDDFRRIGNPNSIAWSRTLQHGPFDVVNIDLCDGLASDPPQNEGSIYTALAQLMALQARNSKPWLLLISTRIRRGMFDADAEQQLIELFREMSPSARDSLKCVRSFWNRMCSPSILRRAARPTSSYS